MVRLVGFSYLPWRALCTHSIPCITRPMTLKTDWRNQRPRHWAPTPPESALIDAGCEEPTGANLDAVAFAASRILSTIEQPVVRLLGQGNFNRVFRLDFPTLERKLIARIPLRSSYACVKDTTSRTAATMAFVHYVLNFPSQRLLAWNYDTADAVGAPYILAELVDDVAEAPWHHLYSQHPTSEYNVLDDMALLHTRLIQPLPLHLQNLGCLAFAEGAVDPSDALSYTVAPWIYVPDYLSGAQRASRSFAFSAKSSALEGMWTELWAYQRDLWLAHRCASVSTTEPIASSEFLQVAGLVQGFMLETLESLHEHAPLMSTCLALEDNAVRNTLFYHETLRVKAFIDWDDVLVLPLALSVQPPSEIMNYIPMGLPVDASWEADGAFYEVPPSHPGENPQPIYDESGNREDPPLIHDMALRRRYTTRLGELDARLSDPTMQRLRHDAMRVHALLTAGGPAWWRRRDWLHARTRAAPQQRLYITTPELIRLYITH
ncbi:hypothetical protein AURDEDRAFT_135909 [Auricularia subglabra TFB-10046 SS5]|nr:hypothetical protein AURDEDRAFT_135909 [Auricularia subglabra TFB-10046 SS5]